MTRLDEISFAVRVWIVNDQQNPDGQTGLIRGWSES